MARYDLSKYRFKKGQCGNPKGRPKDTLKEALKGLERMEHSEGKTYGEVLAERVFECAITHHEPSICTNARNIVFARLNPETANINVSSPTKYEDMSLEELTAALLAAQNVKKE